MSEETEKKPAVDTSAKLKGAGEKADESGDKSYTGGGKQGCVPKDNEKITIKLLGAEDAVIRNELCVVTDSEGNVHEGGRTDAKGVLVVEGLPKGECVVSFSALDRAAWGITGEDDNGDRDGGIQKTRTVDQGEDIDSIAYECGFHPDTIWDHKANKELREKRKDPSVLKEGDKVKIPELEPRERKVQTGETVTFHRKGVPSALRITFSDDDGPRAKLPYIFKIVTRCGTEIPDVAAETDDKGFLVEAIPPNTTEGEIILNPGEDEEHVPFRLGYLDPVDEGYQGVQSMLNNMGYYCGDEDDALGELTIAAVREFQETHMKLTGEELLPLDVTAIDEDTLKAIEEAYSG